MPEIGDGDISDLAHENAGLARKGEGFDYRKLPVGPRDPRQIRLKAFIRAHIGDSPAYRREISQRVGFDVTAGILNGFAAFNDKQRERIRLVMPFSDALWEGQEDMFGRTIGLGEPICPRFFVKGDAEVALRLHELLRRWPEPVTAEALLVTLCPKAVATEEDALEILAGEKPLGLWPLQALLKACGAKGMAVPSVLGLLRGDEPKTELSPEIVTEATVTKRSENDLILEALQAYCGRYQPNWKDMEFEANVPKLYDRTCQREIFSAPERSQLKLVLGLHEGYLFKGTQDLIGAPLRPGMPVVPRFFVHGDPAVAKRLASVLVLLAPEIRAADTLMSILGGEATDLRHAEVILLGNTSLSRRGLAKVIAQWNGRVPDHELAERYLFEDGMVPKTVRFAKTVPDLLKPQPAVRLAQPTLTPVTANAPVTAAPDKADVVTAAEVPATGPAPEDATKAPAGVAPEGKAELPPMQGDLLELLAEYADSNREVFNKLVKQLFVKQGLAVLAFGRELVRTGAAQRENTANNLMAGNSYWDKLRVRTMLAMLKVTPKAFYEALADGGVQLDAAKVTTETVATLEQPAQAQAQPEVKPAVQDTLPTEESIMMETLVTFATNNRVTFNSLVMEMLNQAGHTIQTYGVALVNLGHANHPGTGRNILAGKSFWDEARLSVLMQVLKMTPDVFFTTLKALGTPKAKATEMTETVAAQEPPLAPPAEPELTADAVTADEEVTVEDSSAAAEPDATEEDATEAQADAAADEVVDDVAEDDADRQPEVELPVQQVAEPEVEEAAETMVDAVPEVQVPAQAEVAAAPVVVVTEVQARSSVTDDMVKLVNRLLAEHLSALPEDEQRRRLAEVMRVLCA